MPEQFGEKQHEATPHRRQQAREQGQVARSQDLASAVMLLGALAVLYYFGGGLLEYLAQTMRRQLGDLPPLETEPGTFLGQWHAVSLQLATLLLPIFGLMALVAAGINMAQVGVLFLPQKLAFDFNRVNPLSGFQRLFSLSNAMRLAFGIFKIIIVASVAFGSVWNERATVLALSNLEPLEIAKFLIGITFWTCAKIGLALLILALLDYGYQRWKQERDMRMTSHELREELKTLQGDPQVIARRRSIQRQLILNRIGNEVPQADVVVTNPTELAIAIRYNHETMDAPIVVAKGAGLVAQRIRKLALEHEVPVVERKELARALYKHVEIGKPIPPQQYAAMAEVLRYVYQLKGRQPPGLQAA